MTQLHTIVSRQAAVASRAKDELTELYRLVGHGPMFTGSTREMRSSVEDIPSEPTEVTLPPLTAQKVFQRIQKALSESWDLMATRDRSNQDARADIVVDGTRLAEGVPVSTLLSLEKQLTNLRTVIKSMPVRDPSQDWRLDEDHGFHRTPEKRKAKTRKTIHPVVLYPHTDKHPAQVREVPADDVVGQYVTIEFSGALSIRDRESLVDRVNNLLDAVKTARTEANTTVVTDVRLASELLGYVFAG